VTSLLRHFCAVEAEAGGYSITLAERYFCSLLLSR
jgi:hypothetical protein